MMSRFLLFLAFVPALVFAQTHSIDSHEVYISGNIDAANVANNTYYQAINQVQVDWSIIEVVGPEEWEHSFCFPNCHDIGVTEGNNAFSASSEQYLNCHVYPNGVAGEGIARMLLTTNASSQDTVTWHITIDAVSSIEDASALSIQAHPNPCTGRLDLSGLPIGAEVTFCDASGQCVRQMAITDAPNLTVQDLPTGLFFMTVTSQNKVLLRQRILSL